MSVLNLSIPKIIELIKTNRQFRSSIIEKSDTIVEDIYKLVENPNCAACMTKIESFINQNIDFINSITQVNPPVTTTENKTIINKPQTPIASTPLRVAGEVYEIDADPTQFKELIELSQTQRWIFRGLNILEKVNSDGKKVWMIFFY